MPHVFSKTYIKESPDVVFRAITKIDSFAHFISGVRKSRILSEENFKRISEWEIDFQGTTIKWKEEQIINPINRIMFFKMLDGDYAQYSGQWKVRVDGNGSELEFSFNIEWELENDDPDLVEVLNRKANLAARWALREIRKKIGIGKTLSSASIFSYDRIVSEPIEIIKSDGQRIVGFYDHLERGTIEEPFVICVPGYGETKRDSLLVSYYLAKNKFSVIRYDATDHIGESDGLIYHTTMEKLKEDIRVVHGFVARTYGASKIGIVASSLAARAAYKYASECQTLSLLVSLVGVVNLRDTLLSIYQEDIIGDVQSGKVKESYEVLGFVIDKQFPIDAIKEQYHDLASTVVDVRNAKAPIISFHAEDDAWIKLSEAQLVMTEAKNKVSKLNIVRDAMHQLMENPHVLKLVMKQVVVYAAEVLKCTKLFVDDILEPAKRELAVQSKLEKERLKLKSTYQEKEEKQFWDYYLSKFVILSKVPDYRDYLALMIQLLNISHDNVRILDAGCGNGYLGASLISESILSKDSTQIMDGNRITHSFEYCGLDRSEVILDTAKQMHRAFFKKSLVQEDKSRLASSFHYVVADMNNKLPFKDNHFDRVCGSLLMSYLISPVASLKEMLRILKPGGVIILSSMKPSADISQIYRNFLNVCNLSEDIKAARELLNEAGKIKQKEGEGHYHFYSEQELKTLLFACKLSNIATFRSFGNQANVVCAVKPIEKEIKEPGR